MLVDCPVWVRHGGGCCDDNVFAGPCPCRSRTSRKAAHVGATAAAAASGLTFTLFLLLHAAGDGISGLDISPNGRRLATCGAEPHIIIWNMLPILDDAAEADPDVPKVLAVIQEHQQGSVLTVKFSHSGSILASGANFTTDVVVMLYKQMPTAASKNLLVKYTNKENWRPVASLRGHDLDITSLSWSPGDEYLASGAMDGNVLLFKMQPGGSSSSSMCRRGSVSRRSRRISKTCPKVLSL